MGRPWLRGASPDLRRRASAAAPRTDRRWSGQLAFAARTVAVRSCRGLEIVLVTIDRDLFDPSMTSGLLRGAYDLDDVRIDVAAVAERAGARVGTREGGPHRSWRRTWCTPARSGSRSTSA